MWVFTDFSTEADLECRYMGGINKIQLVFQLILTKTKH